ncbi:hypothetical protein [Brunnivagina elsteri]|uniref:Uncharacterized protein n=1 Tax=Brunnivagina elsteri CCALA 953 TaxID=987040 RepID=A0A2A2TEL3_9CYAN|nr:hypothetical protein [Calothrix elsteri]PAX52153.1 hypothetical protein CK510_20830 [Calothrix elsteri CCALA 953]
MDTFELKVGDTIGVFFYDDWRGSKAVIDEIEDISANGTVTLTSGIRYNKLGREVGALGEGTYLCSIEKAQKAIEKSCLKKEKKEDNSIIDTLHKRRDKASKLATISAIRILHQYGYFNTANSDIDTLESEIEGLITSYLEKQQKID